MAATVRSATSSPPASNTAFVISSTNSGMPSVRSIMSCLSLSGSGLLPVTRSIIAAISRSPRRLRLSAVTYGRPTHGGSNSGRYVIVSSTRSVFSRSTVRPSTSRLVGSSQCTSSKIIRTGLERDSASSWRSALPSSSVAVAARSVRVADNVRRLAGRAFQQAVRRPGVVVKLCASRASSLSSFCLCSIIMGKSGGTLHLADDRVKRAVGVLR